MRMSATVGMAAADRRGHPGRTASGVCLALAPALTPAATLPASVSDGAIDALMSSVAFGRTTVMATADALLADCNRPKLRLGLDVLCFGVVDAIDEDLMNQRLGVAIRAEGKDH